MVAPDQEGYAHAYAYEAPEEIPVGLYEGGAYLAKGMYRASYNCRMRTNDTPDFCPACRLGLDKVLDYNLPPQRK